MEKKYQKIYMLFRDAYHDLLSIDKESGDDDISFWKDQYLAFWRVSRDLVREECHEYSHYNTDDNYTSYAIICLNREIRNELNTMDAIARQAMIIYYISDFGKSCLKPIVSIGERNGWESEEEWFDALMKIDEHLDEYIDEFLGLVWNFAYDIIRMINDYQLDIDYISTCVDCSVSDLKCSATEALFVNKHKDRKKSGKHLTLPQQVLAVKTLLEKFNIDCTNTDKTRISTFVTGIIGRNMDLPPQKSSVYEAVRKDNSQKDRDTVGDLFENVGLKEVAEKIRR